MTSTIRKATMQEARTNQGEAFGRRQIARVLAAATLVSLIILVVGCRSRADQSSARAAGSTETTIAGEEKAEPKAVEAKALLIPDEQFDLPLAEETQKAFALTPGAEISIESFNGRVEVVNSPNESAELYLVRSVREQKDFRNRRLSVEYEPGRLVISMARENRSKLFAMFSGRGPEKQRMILKVPRKASLSIENISGHINVGEIDGAVSVEGIYGRVSVGQVTGEVSVQNVSGQVRLLINGRNKNGVKVDDVNASVELLFVGEVDADLSVDDVNGNVDTQLSNLVFIGERRRNDFKARVGKGGASVDVSNINGRVRFLPATKEDLVARVPASAVKATQSAAK